jgi:RNA polymerase sigma factor (TIGR02999 family)
MSDQGRPSRPRPWFTKRTCAWFPKGVSFAGTVEAIFFAAAAEAMRRILIENARSKRGPKKGGQLRRVDANLDGLAADPLDVDILALDEALTRLAEQSPSRAELVKLRFFAGLTVPEAAEVLGISVATAERYWTYARARLFADLNDSCPAPEA